MGGEGVPGERANVPALWSLAWLRSHLHLPGRQARTARLRCLPRTPASPGLLAEQKEQLHPGKYIAFLRPIDFLIFWHFSVASIPFLVFSSMSQKAKMSKQLRAEISISCQTAGFPALTKRALHRMPRTGKTTNYIIFFFSLNRDNHIPTKSRCEGRRRNLTESFSAIFLLC